MAIRAGLGLSAGLIAAALAGPTMAQGRTQVGVLDCAVSGGTGMIVVGSRELNCAFLPSGGGRPERYVGRLTKVGLNIGVTTAGRLGWGVFAPSRVARGALAGTYVGAGADASIAVGGGANALVGGFQNSVMLQPFSLEGQQGLNLAAGIAGLSLTPVR